jgi:hypothetical protein
LTIMIRLLPCSNRRVLEGLSHLLLGSVPTSREKLASTNPITYCIFAPCLGAGQLKWLFIGRGTT